MLLTVADDIEAVWSDPSSLRTGQYATDRNLAARQSIYRYQDPRIVLPVAVCDVLALTGAETVADIGCGNGAYLAELGRRGHRGRVLGVDLSTGMLAASRERAPAAALIAGDAMGLPVRAGTADVVLAMHMLYHVPDVTATLGELRRVTRPGGRVVILLNCDDHLQELREAIGAVLGRQGLDLAATRVNLDVGEQLAGDLFESVVRLEFSSELRLPDAEPVADYLRSVTSDTEPSADLDRFIADVAGQLDFSSGTCHIRTHSGCLICA
jgi:SAM-dependent methyltransferase